MSEHPARRRVGVLISGRGSNLQALIDAARSPAYPAEIVLVISNVPAVQGLERAKTAGIPTKVIAHKDFDDRPSFEMALTNALKEAEVEIVCLAGFMRILTGSFIADWHGRLINIHPSLLPAFTGLNTHARALAASVKLHGCSVHFVSADLDDGPIIGQAAVPVLPGDDEETLAARVLAVEHELYPTCLKLLAEGNLDLSDGIVRSKGSTDGQSRLINPPPEARS